MLYLIVAALSLFWQRDLTPISAIIFLIMPATLMLTGAIFTRSRIRTSNIMLGIAAISYFFVLLLSHVYNSEELSPRLAHWFLIASSSIFIWAYPSKDISGVSLLIVTVLVFLLIKNSNVQMMTLAAVFILSSRYSKSIGIISLILLTFYGHLFLYTDSLLLTIPLGLSISLTGRERLLSLAFLGGALMLLVAARFDRSQNLQPLGSRDTFFSQAKAAFIASPIIGNGYCGGYFRDYDEFGVLVKHAHGHNLLVTNICETGILGLIPIIPLLAFLLPTASKFDLSQKLFWSIFSAWSITDDPFNFIPFVVILGLIINNR